MTTWRNSRAGWGLAARMLHWAMAALILFMLALGFRMVLFTPDLGRRYDLTQMHKSYGALAFLLAMARILWRGIGGRRPIQMPMPPAQAWAASATHLALYLAMILMPLSGWIMVSASPLQDLLNQPNLAFGWSLPDPFITGDPAIEAGARAVHTVCAITLSVLIALHVVAALWHQFVLKDGLIGRMWRGISPPSPPARR